MNLLIVEDEVTHAEDLRRGLTAEGYVVRVAHDGIEGLSLATEHDYDLVILDVMLPGLNGLALLAALRQTKRTPVLMLTARVAVEDRIRGLQAGADDYLLKPFAFAELVARIEVLVRRRASDAGEARTLALADLEVDLLGRRAIRAQVRLSLTAQEFALLVLLLRHTGTVVSRRTILEQVWDLNFDGNDNALEVAIGRLRSKVDGPFSRPLLHTVRGVGYVLEARDGGS